MDGCNTRFLLGWPIFNGELLVSGSVIFNNCSLKLAFTFTQEGGVADDDEIKCGNLADVGPKEGYPLVLDYPPENEDDWLEKTTMNEDVFPIKRGDFPMSC